MDPNYTYIIAVPLYLVALYEVKRPSQALC
jgi:hypothetical protein